MTPPPSGVRPPIRETDQPIKRRGLFAVGAALVAGLVAKLTETPVSAGVDGDVVLGGVNSTPAQTTVVGSTATSGTGLLGLGQSGPLGRGLEGIGSQAGVFGISMGTGSPGAGVWGSGAANSPGVQGVNDSFTGVRGDSTSGMGVVGTSLTSYGMFGGISPSSSANTIAVYGQNYSTYAGPSPGAGGFGVYGISANGHGLVGATAAPGGAAVVGASNGVAGAYAGAFYGSVVVSGAFTVFGAKSAAVLHPDGSHRRLYCLERPESWFEDFGTGRLECGRAEVTIDPDFAAIVDLSDYHVFLTEYDTDALLRVRHRTAAGFAVEADPDMATLKGKKESDLTGSFSWRVVAKRKDIAGERLAPVTIPAEPTLPPVPKVTTPTPRVAR
jgi:hypothetical protein